MMVIRTRSPGGNAPGPQHKENPVTLLQLITAAVLTTLVGAGLLMADAAETTPHPRPQPPNPT